MGTRNGNAVHSVRVTGSERKIRREHWEIGGEEGLGGVGVGGEGW